MTAPRIDIGHHAAVLLGRLSLLVAALLVCAWFALGVRQSADLTRAIAIANGNRLTPAEDAHANSLLDAAGTLNPDSEVKLVRADLLSFAGHTSAAVAEIDHVLKSEPQNAVAWDELAQLGGSPHLVLDALHHIRKLIPPVPKSS